MADVYSDVATIQQGGTLEKMLPTVIGGRVRSCRAVYVASGTVAAGTKIHLATLPAGARILPISTLTFEAGQSASLTIKVGTASDDDKYLASVTVGASLVTKSLDADRLAGTTEGGEVIATTGGAALVNDKKIVADLYYVVD